MQLRAEQNLTPRTAVIALKRLRPPWIPNPRPGEKTSSPPMRDAATSNEQTRTQDARLTYPFGASPRAPINVIYVQIDSPAEIEIEEREEIINDDTLCVSLCVIGVTGAVAELSATEEFEAGEEEDYGDEEVAEEAGTSDTMDVETAERLAPMVPPRSRIASVIVAPPPSALPVPNVGPASPPPAPSAEIADC